MGALKSAENEDRKILESLPPLGIVHMFGVEIINATGKTFAVIEEGKEPRLVLPSQGFIDGAHASLSSILRKDGYTGDKETVEHAIDLDDYSIVGAVAAFGETEGRDYARSTFREYANKDTVLWFTQEGWLCELGYVACFAKPDIARLAVDAIYFSQKTFEERKAALSFVVRFSLSEEASSSASARIMQLETGQAA